MTNRTAIPSFERVHTVPDWYDGPRAGLADFRREPHFFVSLWRDLSGGEDVFLLWPAGSDDVAVVLEEWAIWLRWADAWALGLAPAGTHPALPADRPRYERIRERAAAAYGRRPKYARPATADWTMDPTRPGLAGTNGGMLARWTLAGNP